MVLIYISDVVACAKVQHSQIWHSTLKNSYYAVNQSLHDYVQTFHVTCYLVLMVWGHVFAIGCSICQVCRIWIAESVASADSSIPPI